LNTPFFRVWVLGSKDPSVPDFFSPFFLQENNNYRKYADKNVSERLKTL
jgi:hypothetical protein